MRAAALLPRVRLHRPGFDLLTVLCLGLILVQAAVSLLGGVPDALWIYDTFGLNRPGLLKGRVWQLATHPFLHGGWFHLLMNWLVIFLVGGRVYHILGARGFAAVFGGGVLGGTVLHLLLHPAAPLGVEGEILNAPLVGASAGAMALLLAVTGLSPDSRMWPLPVSGRNLGKGLLLASLLLFLITPGLWNGLGVPGLRDAGRYLVDHGLASLFQIGHIYHFGGGLVGWFYVKRLLRRPITLQELKEKREKRERVPV